MPLMRSLMQTKAHREMALLRLIVAADLLLDGARAIRWHFLIGDSRLDQLTRLPDSLIRGIGTIELTCAALIAVGFLARPAALVPLILPIMMALTNWSKVQSLQAASRLDATVHCAGIVLASLFLIIKGAGPLSIDALLIATNKRLNTKPRRPQ